MPKLSQRRVLYPMDQIPETVLTTVRLPREVWRAAKVRTLDQQVTLSELVRESLEKQVGINKGAGQ